ncbi:hydrogenase 4 subunit H [Paludibacterium yongneupense]|uniref:hydrogenase 4 subunit H n=1 Tax=Paludibacterium yongneupense TaxID=400061 RepID=UPI00040EE28E|nr:hydrogenase 4 subunit H [Paludibacterium yongneupense]
MFKLLKTVIKTGEATVRYPFAPLPVSPGFRGKPEYDPTQCIACGACTIACPANALSMATDVEQGTRTWELFLGRCIFCARCEEVCPTRAIALSPEFELAVGNKADLYQRATFTLTACRSCQRPFAPSKEIDYAMALLVHSGLEADAVAEQRAHFETCPECKRHQSIPDSDKLTLGQTTTKGGAL